ncbi:MAG: hypothetical protein ACJAS1_004156 [Oleiphilaceae bacterium]|jgi:hypothetical protein
MRNSTASLGGTMRMKRYWPLLFITTGVCVFMGGFIYDILYAGIPYQDPTPEMSASYAHHSLIASMIRYGGFGIFLFGSVAAIIHFVTRQSKKPDRS